MDQAPQILLGSGCCWRPLCLAKAGQQYAIYADTIQRRPPTCDVHFSIAISATRFFEPRDFIRLNSSALRSVISGDCFEVFPPRFSRYYVVVALLLDYRSSQVFFDAHIREYVGKNDRW